TNPARLGPGSKPRGFLLLILVQSFCSVAILRSSLSTPLDISPSSFATPFPASFAKIFVLFRTSTFFAFPDISMLLFQSVVSGWGMCSGQSSRRMTFLAPPHVVVSSVMYHKYLY